MADIACCVCGRRKPKRNFLPSRTKHRESQCRYCAAILFATRYHSPAYGKFGLLRKALIKVNGDARRLPNPWVVSKRLHNRLTIYYHRHGIEPPPSAEVKRGRASKR